MVLFCIKVSPVHGQQMLSDVDHSKWIQAYVLLNRRIGRLHVSSEFITIAVQDTL